MPLTKPQDAIFPKNRIKSVEVLHDGTADGSEFSIARLTMHDGGEAIGIRHDRNEWNDVTDEKGYPTSRGNPSWFILPDPRELTSKLKELYPDAN